MGSEKNNGKPRSASARVYSTTSRLVHKLSSNLNLSATKAKLANLRNAGARSKRANIEAWSFIFEEMDEDFLGKSAKLTHAEKAILSTLEIYAIHQQGQSESVNEEGEYWQNLGYALANLRNTENTSSMDRRFNAVVTSSTFEELIYHLRQMIKLLKSKAKNTKVNYPLLAKDLYQMLLGYQEEICFSWARRYYAIDKKVESEEQGKKESKEQ